MPSYFFRHTVTADIPGSLALDAADVSEVFPYVSAPESGAVGHWQFKDEETALTGLVGGTATLLVDAEDYTWDGEGLVIPDGDLYGVEYTPTDAVTQSLAAIVRIPDDAVVRPVFSTRGVNTDATGFRFSFFGSGHDISYYDSTSGGSILLSGTMPAGSAAGDWVFVAFSENGTTVRLKVGGNDAVNDTILARAANARTIRTGWSYLGAGQLDSLKNAVDIAEAIIFDTALDDAALEALYQRRKADAAARGITVL